jgi:hypothetical protein
MFENMKRKNDKIRILLHLLGSVDSIAQMYQYIPDNVNEYSISIGRIKKILMSIEYFEFQNHLSCVQSTLYIERVT